MEVLEYTLLNIEEAYYGKNDKPTNGEFIALVADKLLMEEQAREKAV